jgi:hypothetical protein
VPPVFEEPPWLVIGQRFEEAGVVGPEAGEQRQKMRSAKNVDAVDLQKTEGVGGALDMLPGDVRRPWPFEPLRRKGNPPRASSALIESGFTNQ